MSDITERLRHIRRDGCLCADKPKKAALLHPICQQAADEIERLRAALREIAAMTARKQLPLTSQINEIAEAALRGQG